MSDKAQSGKAQTLPPTMPCPETGRELRRDTRPFTLRYKAHEVVVDLPGYYPDGDGESVHVGADMAAAPEDRRECAVVTPVKTGDTAAERRRDVEA